MKLPEWTRRPQVHAAGCLLSLLAALAVVAIMTGTQEYTKIRGMLLLTALLVAGFFLTMVAATAMPRSGPGPWFRPLAMGAGAVALALMVLGLWGIPDPDAFWKATAILTILALGLVATGQALSRAAGGTAVRILAASSASLSALLTGMAVMGIALEITLAPYWWAFGLLVLVWIAIGGAFVILRLWRRRSSP